jgi:cysteine desulfurase family protein
MPARTYLDNAATSFPKPESVWDAVDAYNRNLGCAVGRGTSAEGAELQAIVGRCRKAVADLFGAEAPERIVFTFNGTDGLNLALHGLLRPGDHVVTTRMEHNSVIRPLRELERRSGVEITVVEADGTGFVNPDDVRAALRPQTKLLAVIHASNVTGTIQPVQEICEIAREAGVVSLVDAAQSAGHVPIDLKTLPADLLACPGHKGLLGPLGTGLLYIRPGLEDRLHSLRQGGTGSISESEFQPETLPDKYESGNHNAPGLVGLEAALAWLRERGLEETAAHERKLTAALLERLGEIPGVALYGPPSADNRVGVVSLTLPGIEPQELATILDGSFRIQTRAGLHCAPGAHACLGTLETGGTLRASVGPFTTEEDVETLLDALQAVAEGLT